MTDRDPLLRVLTGLVVDLLWWLDTCDDEEIHPDSAVKMMESVVSALNGLTSDQQDRLLAVLNEMATTEEHPGRRHQLITFAFACGLTEEEPPEANDEPAPWVHPDARSKPNP